MPVTLTRLESGIYRSHLTDTVLLEELLASQADGLQMAVANSDERYIVILDIDRSTRMPFDIREAGKLIENDQSLKILSVGASLHIRLLASLLGRLFGLNRLEHLNTLDQAVQRARKLLAG
jgi:hypothetical protein